MCSMLELSLCRGRVQCSRLPGFDQTRHDSPLYRWAQSFCVYCQTSDSDLPFNESTVLSTLRRFYRLVQPLHPSSRYFKPVLDNLRKVSQPHYRPSELLRHSTLPAASGWALSIWEYKALHWGNRCTSSGAICAEIAEAGQCAICG